MAYEALFQPIKIGGVTIKNRIVHCAMGGTSFVGHMGDLIPSMRDYYIERCKGGVGLIIPGVSAVVLNGQHLYEHEEFFMTVVKDAIEEIHSYGTKYFMQLGAGFGRAQMYGGKVLEGQERYDRCVSASNDIPNVWTPEMKHRELTKEEIADIVDSFGMSALMCKKSRNRRR